MCRGGGGAWTRIFCANKFIRLLFQMDASLMLAVESILLQKSNKNLAAVTSLSAHCSPVSNKRHKLNISTASLASSCSSQVNNNYTTSLVDMDSLEDMLRKVCHNILLQHFTLPRFVSVRERSRRNVSFFLSVSFWPQSISASARMNEWTR